MEYVSVLLAIAAIHLLAIASPGPTLAVVTSYSLRGDRRSGLLLALGVVLATLTWASLAAAGLGGMMARFPVIYRSLQIAGAAYLIYLGVRLLLAVMRPRDLPASATRPTAASGWAALRAGFITNIANPKVVAYYASLFGVMIPSGAPGWVFWAAAATAMVVSAMWWACVSLFFSIPVVSQAYERIKPKVDIVMGVILILLGLRLAILG